MVISNILDSYDYEQWKSQYKVETQKDTIIAHEPVATYKTTAEMLLKKIREYPLENSTPMQTMLFVQELKKEIKNGFSI